VRVPQREAIQKQLSSAGVPTAVHYPLPLHRQPAFRDESPNLPESDKAAHEVLSLPMGAYLSVNDQDQVCRAVAAACALDAR